MVHKNKIESNKKLIFKKKICFPKFPLFHTLPSFDLNFLFMYYGHFPPKSSQKLIFVLFKPEKVRNAAEISNPGRVTTFSDLKRTNLNFRLLLGGN